MSWLVAQANEANSQGHTHERLEGLPYDTGNGETGRTITLPG